MATDLKSLATLFNERMFRIPDYQRGYSWNTQQLEDFWQDLRRLPAGRSHYTGQLTLEPVDKDRWSKWSEEAWLIEENCRPFYVVDGQQRLTTSIVPIKCLLDKFEDHQEVARAPKATQVMKYLVRRSGTSAAFLFGYERDNPSYECLKTRILSEQSNSDQSVETLYTTNLLNAKKFFEGRIAREASSFAEAEELFRRLTQRFLFNEYEISSDFDVFVAFETMNNRGKPLSKLELLKTRLIYLSTLVEAPEAERASLRRDINEAWKTVYEYLGKEPNNPLEDDEFLRAHWVMLFEYARDQKEQYAAFLLEQHFTAERALTGKLSALEIKEYIDSIQKAARTWHAIHFPATAPRLSDEIRLALDRLCRVGWGAFAPLAMAVLVRDGVKEADRLELLQESERFVFLVSRLCKGRSDTGDSEFYRLAGQFFRGEKSIGETVRTVRSRTEKHFSWKKAQDNLLELFEAGSGFYGWDGLKYFLFEYESSLRDASRASSAKIDWYEFTRSRKDHVTVEHIFPQTPVRGEWPAFEALPSIEAQRLRNSLGNLVPLAKSKNSSLCNRSFSEKVRSRDGSTGYFNGSCAENELAGLTLWEPSAIEERGLRLLTFLERRWNTRFEDRESKLRFLNIGFSQP